MHRQLLVAMAIGLLTFCASAEETAVPVVSEPLDPLWVTGEQPGPGLWKVTKQAAEGERTLWILGIYGPLPKKVTWRSKQVAEAIARSQEVLSSVRIDVDVDVGFFATLAALPSLVNIANNPDNAKLKDVVPADVYAKWLPLKAKYIGRDNDVEALRPTFAMEALYSKAREKMGLVNSPSVWPTVVKIAKKHGVKVIEPEIKRELKVSKPRTMLKKFKKVQLADVECFARSLDRLESDLDALSARANAWAIGDVQRLRRLPDLDPSENCIQMLRQAVLHGSLAEEVGAQDLLKEALRAEAELTQQAQAKWLALVETALAQNETTFAVLPVAQLLDAEGPLAKLQAKGYSVSEP